MIYAIAVFFIAAEIWQRKNLKGREHAYLFIVIFCLGMAVRTVLWAVGL